MSDLILTKNGIINKENTYTRLKYLDNAKGLGMFMIMMGHMSYLNEPFFTFCSSIKILIFYIVSGFLFAYKEENNSNAGPLKEYVYKKVKVLGIPYVLYSLCAMAIDLLMTFVTHSDPLKALGNDVANTVILRGISTLWFLPTLFFADILFAAANKAVIKIRYPLLAVFPLINLILCSAYRNMVYQIRDNGFAGMLICNITAVVLKSLTAFVFVVYGYVLYDLLKKLWDKSCAWLIALFAGMLTVILALLNKGVDFNSFSCGKYPWLYIINGYLCGALIIFLLKKCDGVINFRVLNFIGANSLFIMATHLPWKISIVVKKLFGKVYIAENAGVSYYLVLICSTALVLFIEYFMIKAKDIVLIRCKKYEKLYDVLKYI